MRCLTALSTDNENLRVRNKYPTSPPVPIAEIAPASSSASLIQRSANCACGGGCPSCRGVKSAQTADAAEHEADHAAELLGPESRLQTANRDSANSDYQGLSSIVREVINSPGSRLDPRARLLMESTFGRSFSQVRIHTDTKSAQSAESINALAYTVGRDVVFGAGQYSPETASGQRLLAHELAHVAQQSARGKAVVQKKEQPLKGRTSTQAIDYRDEEVIDRAIAASSLWPYLGYKIDKLKLTVKGNVDYAPRADFEKHYIESHGRTQKAKDEAKTIGGYYEPKTGRIQLPERASLANALHEALHKFQDGAFRGFFGQLQEGFTQYLANMVLRDNDLDAGTAYPDETPVAELVAGIVGWENLALSYFLGPPDLVVNQLQSRIAHFEINVFLEEIRKDKVDWSKVRGLLQRH
jgi:hypothetical protein